MAGYIEDRWWTERPDPETGKKRKTALYGKDKRYKVTGHSGRARQVVPREGGCGPVEGQGGE
ncbi:hypothetical protein [Streptomyces chrestomyceticus]|uniref:hypothetical protein n=1 Tax=Streptomyces chrestomyceticus TaxID=68185 RepID=UPI00067D2AE4